MSLDEIQFISRMIDLQKDDTNKAESLEGFCQPWICMTSMFIEAH